MTDKLNPTILQALNLTEQDFEPKPQTAQNNAEPTAAVGTEERITALEQALEASLAALRDLGVTGDE